MSFRHKSLHPRRSQSALDNPARALAREKESGYAYLMALFMVLAMVIGSQVVLRNLAAEGRSEREADMIWRGNQYVRAIRMYYRKTGHYPQKQDDLLTGVPSIHFLRSEAIKDPMNKDNDGAWRFIYTNAAGQIIGSVKYGSMQQMAMMDMNGGPTPGVQQGTGTSNDSSQTSTSSNSATTTPIATMPGIAPTTTPGAAPGIGTTGTGAAGAPGQTGATLGPGQVLGPLGQPAQALGAMQPTGPVDGPVIGGQLIGIGSAVDRASVKVYKGGTKYNQWEFIWNPLEEQARAVQQGLGQGGQPGVPGLNLPGLPLGPTNGIPGPGGAPGTPGNFPGAQPGTNTPPASNMPGSSTPQN